MLPASPRRTIVLAVSTVLCASAGAAVITAFSTHTPRSRAYVSTPQFKVWTLVIVLAWASLPFVWSVGVRLFDEIDVPIRPLLRRHAAWEIAAVLGAVAVGWLSGGYARGSSHPRYYFGLERIIATYAAGVVAVIPIFLFFGYVYGELTREQARDWVDNAELLTRIRLITDRRRALTTGLTVAGTLVSLGVLATGAQRQALLAVQPKAPDYPPVYVVVWGITASAILVAGFVPGYRRLVAFGEKTVDGAFPMISPHESGWRDRVADRATLTNLLKVTQGFKDVVNSALVVGAPLVSAAFSLLLPSSG
jgi:hypothetical protein